MESKTYYVPGPDGQKIPVTVKKNKKLLPNIFKRKDNKDNKNKGLRKKIATTALILGVGAGTVLAGRSIWKHFSAPKASTSVYAKEYTTSNDLNVNNNVNNDNLSADTIVKQGLRFNPNTEESIIDKSVYLIEDAAKAGKQIDALDAVLTVVVANSNEITAGFMGKLFGEAKDQTYTYNKLVDAYLRTGMIEVENMGISKNDDLAFNVENIFANEEDYEYLANIRTLTTNFNNSKDTDEKKSISEELNKIAFDLCTYEAYDINSPASVLSMLSLDGMRIVTNTNSNYTILPNDIRDEMFGSGDYSCHTDATFTSDNGEVLQTHYSYRVNDLKLDSVKTKLDNAILAEGEITILDSIISEVKERTKDVVVADIDTIGAINETMEENRDVTYEYESSKGTTKPNYTEKEKDDHVEKNNGKDVIVSQDNTSKPSNDKTQEEAEKELEDKVADAQAEANKGASDGKYYGENGLKKPSLNGKSEIYKNAFNASYDAYKAIYDAKHSTEEDTIVDESFEATEPENNQNKPSTVTPTPTKEPIDNSNNNSNSSSDSSDEDIIIGEEFIPLDSLTAEQLKELKDTVLGDGTVYTENSKTK